VRYQSSYEKAAHLYDIFDQKPNIDFFRYCAREQPSVIDIGAGTGRIAIPIARAGTAVYCIEPSPAMRTEFTKKLKVEPDLADRITMIAGDAQSFRIKRSFGVAFMSGVFDHLLDDTTRIRVLKNVNRHLIRGGMFVFDVAVGIPGGKPLVQAGSHRIGTKMYQRYISSKVCANATSEVRLLYEVYDSGKLSERIEEKGIVAYVSRTQVCALLAKAGFTITHEYGWYDFSAYKEGSELLIVEAKKEQMPKRNSLSNSV
jgi:SAM-dependent methyltransferase